MRVAKCVILHSSLKQTGKLLPQALRWVALGDLGDRKRYLCFVLGRLRGVSCGQHPCPTWQNTGTEN